MIKGTLSENDLQYIPVIRILGESSSSNFPLKFSASNAVSQRCSLKKMFLKYKNFTNFAKKHECRSLFFKGTVRQIEKAQINDQLYAPKAFWKFRIPKFQFMTSIYI